MRILLSIIVVMIFFISHEVQAISRPVTINSSELIVEQGEGWALVEANVDRYQTMLTNSGKYGGSEYIEAENLRGQNLLVITTVKGLITTGLPDSYIQKKLNEYGYQYPANYSDYGKDIGPLIVDPIGVDKVFNTTSSSIDQSGLFSCSDKNGSESFHMDVGNKNMSKSYDVNSNVDVTANIGLGASGKVEVEVFYKEDRSFFSGCLTYDVDYKYHSIKSKVNFIDTSVNLSGSVKYKYEKNLFSGDYKLATYGGSFWVWIVEFDWEVGVGIKLDVDLIAEAKATIAYEGKINGNMDIFWKCRNTNCTPLKKDIIDIDFSPNEQLLYSLELDIIIEPKLTIYAYADLDLYFGILDVVRAEVGVVLAAPLRFYAYRGNNCSDADGNGYNETVNGMFIDWNAELYAYWNVGLFNSSGITQQISFGIGGWEDIYSIDTVIGGRVPILRKHLLFIDLLNPISTIFTPVIGGGDDAKRTMATSFNIKPRSCYPFHQAVTYNVNWGDGTSETISTSSSGKVISHTWSQLGSKNISVTLNKDTYGREFGSSYNTVRAINVIPAIPDKPSITGTNCREVWGSGDKFGGVNYKTVCEGVSVSSARANNYIINYRVFGEIMWNVGSTYKPGKLNEIRAKACNLDGCSNFSEINRIELTGTSNSF
jgi:hypothetical protein